MSEPLEIKQGHGKRRLTISIGGSVFPNDGISSDELIYVADLALYRAKQNGRNRVEFAKPDDNAPDAKGATA